MISGERELAKPPPTLTSLEEISGPALAAMWSPRNGTGAARLTHALGGHPPPLALRRDGRVEPLGEPGSRLGAIRNPSLADAATHLAPGESLVLYTDGVPASHNGGDADDPEWLARERADAAGEGSEEIAAHLASAAIQRQGGKPRDDIAVVVLRRERA